MEIPFLQQISSLHIDITTLSLCFICAATCIYLITQLKAVTLQQFITNKILVETTERLSSEIISLETSIKKVITKDSQELMIVLDNQNQTAHKQNSSLITTLDNQHKTDFEQLQNAQNEIVELINTHFTESKQAQTSLNETCTESANETISILNNQNRVIQDHNNSLKITLGQQHKADSEQLKNTQIEIVELINIRADESKKTQISLDEAFAESTSEVLSVLNNQNSVVHDHNNSLKITLVQQHKVDSEQLQNAQNEIVELINTRFTESEQAQVTQHRVTNAKTEGNQESLLDMLCTKHQQLEVSLSSMQEANDITQRRNLSTQKHEQIMMVEQLSSYIERLRIENAVELANSLAYGKELKIETKEFIKHLGDYKVTKMEDKASNQVTEVFYKEGKKVSSQTFADNVLKYQMSFNDDEKLTKGEEFDSEGNIAFEYHYNSAGEITNRIDT